MDALPIDYVRFEVTVPYPDRRMLRDEHERDPDQRTDQNPCRPAQEGAVATNGGEQGDGERRHEACRVERRGGAGKDGSESVVTGGKRRENEQRTENERRDGKERVQVDGPGKDTSEGEREWRGGEHSPEGDQREQMTNERDCHCGDIDTETCRDENPDQPWISRKPSGIAAISRGGMSRKRAAMLEMIASLGNRQV